MKKALSVLKLSVVAAVAACALSGSASAQSLVKGSFTLPYEVHWGKAVLPAGSYVISMDSERGPAFVRTSTGAGRAIVMAQTVETPQKGQPTALIVTQRENQRTVRLFNWREGNRTFVYAPFTKAERKLYANADSVAIPILMAQK